MRALAVIMAWALLVPATEAWAGGHIEASHRFLMAWGKSNWEELAAVAGQKVPVATAGKEVLIDVAGRRAGAILLFPFRGLSAVRVDGDVKGVTLEEIAVRLGSEEKKGKGALTLEEKDGRVTVIKVAIE